jgi:hypothetical protein
MSINVELEKLYLEDKKEREQLIEGNEISKIIRENDKKRIERVQEMLSSIDTNEIWNCHYLAYVFQHGETEEDFRLAHFYAKRAVDMGSNVTKWLYAATLDRLLVSQGRLQKYGTQFQDVNGKWELLPVDGTISDKEREEYGVASLGKVTFEFANKYK